MTVTIKWADATLKKYEREIVQLQAQFPRVAAQEVNKVGARAKTLVVRKLAQQTGLDKKVIAKAIGNPSQARPGKLMYEMKTKGGNIRLRFFNPKETPLGVTAKPFGKTTVYKGAFMKGGAWPNRKDAAKLTPDVWRRLNSRGTKITQQKSGVFIPVEMVQGATGEAFDKLAAPLLEQRIERVIKKLLK